jgi:DNA-binding MarR family transcriptional regulator
LSTPEFGILLVLASNSIVDRIHDAQATAGFDDVRSSFGAVFRALQGDGLTLTDLAATIGVTKQSAAALVDDMAARGYVEKRAAVSDRRAVQLVLTTRALEAIAIAKDAAKRAERSLTRAVGAENVAAMRVALEHFVAASGYEDELRSGRVRAPW